MFVKLNRQSASEFLKGIRSGGKASLVCESTEWKGRHEPPAWALLPSGPSLLQKAGAFGAEKVSTKAGWPASHLPPKLNFLILHLLTAGRSHSSDYVACGWAGLESRGQDRGRGLKHQVWGFYAPGCCPELDHFSGVSWNRPTAADAVSSDLSESQGWCKILLGTVIHVIIKHAKETRVQAKSKETSLVYCGRLWEVREKDSSSW